MNEYIIQYYKSTQGDIMIKKCSHRNNGNVYLPVLLSVSHVYADSLKKKKR